MKYEAVDSALLAAIKEHEPIRFSRLEHVRAVAIAVEQAAQAMPKDRFGAAPESFRIIDRRLQALRKRNLIVPGRSGWFLVQA